MMRRVAHGGLWGCVRTASACVPTRVDGEESVASACTDASNNFSNRHKLISSLDAPIQLLLYLR